MVDDLSDLYAELRDLKKRLRRLETATPLQNAAITRGSLRVASNEGLKVEGSAKVDGWLIVAGTERVTGRLEGSGTFDWAGPLNLKGDGQITGNMTVKPGGRITVEGGSPIVLEQASGVARMRMGAAEVVGGNGGIGLYPSGGPQITVGALGLVLGNLPTISKAASGLPAGALHIDGSGLVRRVV